MKPYKNKTIDATTFIREFSIDVNENELVWHRDKNDRIIQLIEGENWYIQFDNFMPEKLTKNEEIFIPKNTFHRVIKGTTPLIIKIIEKK